MSHMWFQPHRWEPIDARQGRYVIARGAATLVLYRCGCGKTKTETLDGHWTLDQIRGGS